MAELEDVRVDLFSQAEIVDGGGGLEDGGEGEVVGGCGGGEHGGVGGDGVAEGGGVGLGAEEGDPLRRRTAFYGGRRRSGESES